MVLRNNTEPQNCLSAKLFANRAGVAAPGRPSLQEGATAEALQAVTLISPRGDPRPRLSRPKTDRNQFLVDCGWTAARSQEDSGVAKLTH